LVLANVFYAVGQAAQALQGVLHEQTKNKVLEAKVHCNLERGSGREGG